MLEFTTDPTKNRQETLGYLTLYLGGAIEKQVTEMTWIANRIMDNTQQLEEILKNPDKKVELAGDFTATQERPYEADHPVPNLYAWAKNFVTGGGERNYNPAYEHAIVYNVEPPYRVRYASQLNNTEVEIATPDCLIFFHHNHPSNTIAPLSRTDCKIFFETNNIQSLIAHGSQAGMTTMITRCGKGNLEEDSPHLFGLYLTISKYMRESPVLQSEEHQETIEQLHIRQMIRLNIFNNLGLLNFGVQFDKGSVAEQQMKHEGPSEDTSWLQFAQREADRIVPVLVEQQCENIDVLRQAMGMSSINEAIAAMNTWLYSHTPDGEERAPFLPDNAKVLPHHALMMDPKFLEEDTNWEVITARQQHTNSQVKE
ncbi:MAG: hypothetical protein ACK5YL_00195 [Holosporales bacterium]|jgi:hypothetical protein